MRTLLVLALAGPLLAVDPPPDPLAVRVAALEANVLGLDAKLDRILSALAAGSGRAGNVTVNNLATAGPAADPLAGGGWIRLPDGTLERPTPARTRPAVREVPAEVPFTLPPVEVIRAPVYVEPVRLTTPATNARYVVSPNTGSPVGIPTGPIPTFATAAVAPGVISSGGCVGGRCATSRTVSTVSGPGYRARSVVRQR